MRQLVSAKKEGNSEERKHLVWEFLIKRFDFFLRNNIWRSIKVNLIFKNNTKLTN